jgi:predicted DNA-binding transcriptional regulator AlpA
MAEDLPRLLDDNEVSRLLGYRHAAAFRRHRKELEAQGFPQRRPVVKRYSPTEIRAWIDGRAIDQQQSIEDPLLGVAGQWGKSA